MGRHSRSASGKRASRSKRVCLTTSATGIRHGTPLSKGKWVLSPSYVFVRTPKARHAINEMEEQQGPLMLEQLLKAKAEHPRLHQDARFHWRYQGSSVKQTFEAKPASRPTSSRKTITPSAPVKQKSVTSSTKSDLARCRIASSNFDKEGLGLKAMVSIGAGETIMYESRFLVLDHPPRLSQIRRRLDRLSLEDRNAFHSFPSTSPDASKNVLIGVIVANVIPLGNPEPIDDCSLLSQKESSHERKAIDRDGLFRYLCRINHSCAPNARWNWDAVAGRMNLKAILPIAIGQEITASYLEDKTALFEERQAILSDTWGFACKCGQCSLSKLEQYQNDLFLSTYRKIEKRYIGHHCRNLWRSRGFDNCWRSLRRAICCLEQTRRSSELAACWESMFYLAAAWAREKEAKEAAKGWKAQMPHSGEKFGAHEEVVLENPRSLDTWGDFVEVEDDYDDYVSHKAYDLVYLTADHCSSSRSNPVMEKTTLSRRGTTIGTAKGDNRPNRPAAREGGAVSEGDDDGVQSLVP